MSKSILEERAMNIIEKSGFSRPRTEYKFHDERRWRFDLAYPKDKIAIEIEGAIWTNGRHSRGSGFSKDMEKYNEAAMMGWKVLRYSTSTLGRIPIDLERLMKQ